MSQNIAAFFEKVQSTPELQQKLEAISGESPQEKAEAIAALSQESGTPFSAEEFLATLEASSQEIDEAELDAVAGGAFPNIYGAMQKIFRSSSSTD